MALVDLRDILGHAYRNRYAVATFNFVNLDSLTAVIAAAEAVRAPLILSLTDLPAAGYDFELAMAASETAARRATVPMAIQYAGGAEPGSAARAINLGCNGVTVDVTGSPSGHKEAAARAVVETAHACGVAVEIAPGIVFGAQDESARTAVGAAPELVANSGADFLAIAIGAGYAAASPKAALDLLAHLGAAVPAPLTAHPVDLLSGEQCRQLIERGVARIDWRAWPVDRVARADVEAAHARLRAEAEDRIRRCGAAGRADEVLGQSRPWQTVEHLIVYNVEGIDAARAEHVMREGRDVLTRIPGVRRVASGQAVADGVRYRFCWIIEFTDRAVIASYRDHPLHVEFADRLFRPVAGDRISIDYLLTE